MPMFIDGIGSSQALDTAGEMVDLKGLDCSSLVGGPFNWEHKSDTPNQLVGKILKVKKIFEESDCEDDRQKMYWDSCKTPFLYVMGRLFDDKKDSAKEVAALFLDDSENPNEAPMVGFSVEGSKINKTGMVVTHSIARKMTITNNPANKTCIAKMIPAQGAEKQDDLDSIFKSEKYTEIDIGKNVKEFEALQKGNTSLGTLNRNGKRLGKQTQGKMAPDHAQEGAYAHYSPEDHSDSVNTRHELTEHKKELKAKFPGMDQNELAKSLSLVGSQGKKIGQTGSGKDVHSHAKIADYHDFSSEDHKDAMNLHHNLAQSSKDQKVKSFHADKSKLHMSRASTMDKLASDKKQGMKDAKAAAVKNNVTVNTHVDTLYNPKMSGLKKSEKSTLDPIETKVPAKFKNKKTALSKPVDSTIEHIQPSMDRTMESAYLASGHESHGHKPGKFKIGDNVHMRPHIQGTHILEHKDMKKSEDRHAGYNAQVDHAKKISDDLNTKGKELGQTGSSFSHSVKTKGIHGAGFNNLPAADKFADHASKHPGVHSIKRSSSHEHHFVEANIKTPSEMSGSKMKKSMTAGSGMAAPSQLTGGAALASESIDKKMKKSKWLARAEEEYNKWEKREEFRSFMQKKMPMLKSHEIDSIGKSLVLSKSMKAEKSLKDMSKTLYDKVKTPRPQQLKKK